MRLAVTGIVAAVETLMQSDTTQFGGNVLFPDPGLKNLSLPQNSTDHGALARQTFDLTFRCRIGVVLVEQSSQHQRSVALDVLLLRPGRAVRRGRRRARISRRDGPRVAAADRLAAEPVGPR